MQSRQYSWPQEPRNIVVWNVSRHQTHPFAMLDVGDANIEGVKLCSLVRSSCILTELFLDSIRHPLHLFPFLEKDRTFPHPHYLSQTLLSVPAA
jgi:hypothetical protein